MKFNATVEVTVKARLKVPAVPNFILMDDTGPPLPGQPPGEAKIRMQDLDVDSAEALAAAWVADFCDKATIGRNTLKVVRT